MSVIILSKIYGFMKTIINRQRLLIFILLITSCSQISIKEINSDNYNERIRYLVIHYTTTNYAESVRLLTAKDGVSAHYLIPESNDPTYDGEIKAVKLVNESRRAWHAGRSYWHGQHNLNDQSIDIELVYKAPCAQLELTKEESNSSIESGLNQHANELRSCFYPEFDQKQINVLIKLIKQIQKNNPEITPERIIGHADITPDRRTDPGPQFPWHQLYKAGIGAWYDNKTSEKYWQLFQKNKPSISLVQSALRAYGYGVIETGILDTATINALTVFQMHFTPWQSDGKPLFALIEKYRSSKISALLDRFEMENNGLTTIIKTPLNGQIFGIFPKQQQSNRTLVNNRTTFKSYRGRGELKIRSLGAKSAKIYINGKNINNKLLKNIPYISNKSTSELVSKNWQNINISKLTNDGINTIKIVDILPLDTQIEINIPYPKLKKGKAKDVGFSNNKLKKIDQLINKEIKNGFPGATLVIVKNGKIIKESAYGYSSRFDKNGIELFKPIKMTEDTLFDLASNTKMYATNYALMKLSSEGKINVNLPISHYIKEYQGNGKQSRLVSDLLSHSAGYPPVVNFHDKYNNKFGEEYFSQNKKRTQELLIKKVPFIMGRGIISTYSDIDYLLLGTLIEKVTGMNLDTYVESQIYQPLGLTKTLFNPLQKNISLNNISATELQGNTRSGENIFENVRTDVVHGQVHDEKAFYSMQGVAGHAGLFSTAKEIATLASVMLNRGGYGDVSLFNKSQMDQFTKPIALDITQGLGWRRAGNGERAWQFGPYASPYAIGHTGWTGTVTVIDPFYDLIIVLLTNKKHTEIIKTEDGKKFKGDTFETGKYGSIISLVYEAFLEK
jgi:N-acetyl-anhydromuramyl-L-alanine amidase AmpD/CubicO group peptidase (beta-lactamase class C family)